MDDCRVLCPHDAPTSGYMYHNAQNREAAKAAVAAAEPDLPAKEANQAVMKKLAEMWGALDDAAKQKYKDDAPMVEVKAKKAPKEPKEPKVLPGLLVVIIPRLYIITMV